MVGKITKVENILEHGRQPQQLQPLCRHEQSPCSPLHQRPWAFQAINGSLENNDLIQITEVHLRFE